MDSEVKFKKKEFYIAIATAALLVFLAFGLGYKAGKSDTHAPIIIETRE
ncbi:MAG: hypothetical protein HYS87_02750 [Candidatus Colwellbacteria bacterium]|nr:hypothetical protein [Candidatus Colwellbacteria bacterium]